MTDLSHIRNFSIVAHIDHGKSTLADRLIQKCGAVSDREMKEQLLDNMDIERERGITIKAQTVRLNYKAKDGKDYILNLIDTPGHVDFGYEVSRSLAACEGSLLVVDASQGVEAQTLANVYKALDANHEIVPIINKIDLPAAEPDRVKAQIEDVIGIDASEAPLISAKTGIGIDEVLETIVTKLPAPEGNAEAPLKAMLVDSWYDSYLGIIVLVRVIDGTLKKGMNIKMMATNAAYKVERLGHFIPKMQDTTELKTGELADTAQEASQSQVDHNVGSSLTGGNGTGVLRTQETYLVQRTPVALVTHRNGFVALILDELAQVDDGHRHIQISDAAVAHRGVVGEVSAFLNTAQRATHNAEAQADDGLCVGHDLLGVHLDGSGAPTVDGANAYNIGAHAFGSRFDVFCCDHKNILLKILF